MRNWFLRGLVFAAVMVVVRLIQGVLINGWESQAGLISAVLLLAYLVGVIAWGYVDGRADATATPDPDRRKDLAMTWLGAGLVAGGLSGLVAWLISLFYRDLYVGGLINELTSFAAFTALLVFVPAVAAVALGRRLVDRNYAKLPQHHHGLAALEAGQSPTDVFAAVGALAAVGAAGDEASGAGVAPAPGAPGQVVSWTAEDLAADTATETTETVVAPASPEETTAIIPAVDAVDPQAGETPA